MQFLIPPSLRRFVAPSLLSRSVAASLLLLLLPSCTSQPRPQPAPVAQFDDDRAIAASLVLNAPITRDNPPLDLARADRRPAAYAGFEELTITSYYLYQDDHQRAYNNGWNGVNQDRFSRQAVTTRVGVSYR